MELDTIYHILGLLMFWGTIGSIAIGLLIFSAAWVYCYFPKIHIGSPKHKAVLNFYQWKSRIITRKGNPGPNNCPASGIGLCPFQDVCKDNDCQLKDNIATPVDEEVFQSLRIRSWFGMSNKFEPKWFFGFIRWKQNQND